MKVSVFSGMYQYIRGVMLALWSLLGSCATALPYLLRWGDSHKEVTEGYPDPVSSKTADDLPPRSRGLLFNDIDRCTGCGSCQSICPAQCIRIEAESGAEPNKLWVSVFDIDFSKCMFCGLCVEACEPGSLVHTKKYEGAAYSLEDLVSNFGRGQVTSEQKKKWAALRQVADADEAGEVNL